MIRQGQLISWNGETYYVHVAFTNHAILIKQGHKCKTKCNCKFVWNYSKRTLKPF